MIICLILITKQLILCESCKENLHTDKLAGAAGKGWLLNEHLLFQAEFCVTVEEVKTECRQCVESAIQEEQKRGKVGKRKVLQMVFS